MFLLFFFISPLKHMWWVIINEKRLTATFLISTHNMCFCEEIRKLSTCTCKSIDCNQSSKLENMFAQRPILQKPLFPRVCLWINRFSSVRSWSDLRTFCEEFAQISAKVHSFVLNSTIKNSQSVHVQYIQRIFFKYANKKGSVEPAVVTAFMYFQLQRFYLNFCCVKLAE